MQSGNRLTWLIRKEIKMEPSEKSDEISRLLPDLDDAPTGNLLYLSGNRAIGQPDYRIARLLIYWPADGCLV